MYSVLEAISQTASAFRSCDLDPPDVILLKTRDQGMRFLSQLLHQTTLWIPLDDRGGKVIEHPDGSAWMQVEVRGIKIRWPAIKSALKKGGYVWT